MAKKTYKTYSLKSLQILLFDESGHTMEVNFRGGVQIDSTAKFSTSDEKVQEAIEKCSGFNRDFYLESVSEDNGKHRVLSESNRTENDALKDEGAPESEVSIEETEEETVSGEVSIEETEEETVSGEVKVADRSEAIEWLKEKFPDKGYTKTNLKGKAFDEACAECGVKFVFA